jgi:hypothetical protein
VDRCRRISRNPLFAPLCALLALAFLAGCPGGKSKEISSPVLVIETAPESGADVTIANVPRGRTPVTIRDLAAGQYYAILSQYGYKRNTRMITLPETGEVRLTIEMRPIVGYLSIESTPPGARVYLDGTQLIGTTPLVAEPVKVGMVSYELRMDKFTPTQGTVEIQEEYRVSRTHILEPMRGAVSVISRPSGSQVYINDVIQEQLTPATFQLPPGSYSVGAYQKGYLMGESTIAIEPEGKHRVELDLKPGFMPPGMVLVPAGEFVMGVDNGAPDERPRRMVNVPAFYIDKFEVTNRDFKVVFPKHTFEERKIDHPVTGVTWTQALSYAQAVGKRLPTEEEWEKAARGLDGRDYPWGNAFDPQMCNCKKEKDQVSGTSKIGQNRPGASPFGMLDMAGNAFEWTSSWYQPYPGNNDVKNEYGQVYRVLRGGSYTSDRFGVRAAARHYDKIDSRREDYGFRCAMDATATDPAAKP